MTSLALSRLAFGTYGTLTDGILYTTKVHRNFILTKDTWHQSYQRHRIILTSDTLHANQRHMTCGSPTLAFETIATWYWDQRHLALEPKTLDTGTLYSWYWNIDILCWGIPHRDNADLELALRLSGLRTTRLFLAPLRPQTLQIGTISRTSAETTRNFGVGLKNNGSGWSQFWIESVMKLEIFGPTISGTDKTISMIFHTCW